VLPLFANTNPAFNQIELALNNLGYHGDLLVPNCQYADVLSNKYEVREVALAGFARTPRSYRNACIGVVISNGVAGAQAVAQHKSLGAPLFFEITEKTVERWKITESGEPEWKESILQSQIHTAFNQHANEWGPDRIFRAKVLGEVEGISQLDFFDIGLLPLLEGMAHKKLDKLLREVLQKIEGAYQKLSKKKLDYEDVYRLVFRLIVAKVMRDRSHLPVKLNDAIDILTFVENYYKVGNSPLIKAHNREAIIYDAWAAISRAFHFQNLSVDDLAFVYENSFVTPETRKIFGTHSTPPRIAEYIVHKLPFDEVPEADRYVLEPCAGHGGFLISAMRRLSELLPNNLSSSQKHKYLVKHLTAIEIESFAIEACWSRLVLADYPHPNGWRILQEDIFIGNTLEEELKKARIVFCNPPFEDFKAKERKYYSQPHLLPQKPAEILRRILKEPPMLLGLVLPRIFESSASYRKFHRQLAETYDQIELLALPNVFNYSDVSTMLVMASGKRQHFGGVAITCRKVNEGEERDSFLYHSIEPPAARATYSAEKYLSPEFSLWIPPLSRVWAHLREYKTLSTVANIHRGINWKSRTESYKQKVREVISDIDLPGYKKGYARVENHFEQYSLKDPQYLSVIEDDQYDQAYKLPWNLPKVACNTARLRRNAWRLGAVADTEGLAFSQRFFGIWAKENISIFALAALLNSPLASAFSFANEEGRDNRVKVMKALPIPSPKVLENGGKIDHLSRDLHDLIEKNQEVKKETLLELEAEILCAYDLPPILERELLDTFQGKERPIPIAFNGYYPNGFKAYIPLHELISKEFENARADKLLQRIILIDDPEISEALARRRGEVIDESISS
jgi:hypothetical protein